MKTTFIAFFVVFSDQTCFKTYLDFCLTETIFDINVLLLDNKKCLVGLCVISLNFTWPVQNYRGAIALPLLAALGLEKC